MGASLRVIVEFKKNFWGDTVGFILGSSNFPEYFSVGTGRSEFNRTLSITVNGEKAAQYSAMGDDVLGAILADIDKIYEGQGTQFVRQDTTTLKNIFIREDWTKSDYILGGYSYPLPGAKNDDRKAIGQPVNDKLFFAGEATDITGQAGMVNGALASAERVAQEVVTAIKKTS
jgi:monoamine oxidase